MVLLKRLAFRVLMIMGSVLLWVGKGCNWVARFLFRIGGKLYDISYGRNHDSR